MGSKTTQALHRCLGMGHNNSKSLGFLLVGLVQPILVALVLQLDRLVQLVAASSGQRSSRSSQSPQTLLAVSGQASKIRINRIRVLHSQDLGAITSSSRNQDRFSAPILRLQPEAACSVPITKRTINNLRHLACLETLTIINLVVLLYLGQSQQPLPQGVACSVPITLRTATAQDLGCSGAGALGTTATAKINRTKPAISLAPLSSKSLAALLAALHQQLVVLFSTLIIISSPVVAQFSAAWAMGLRPSNNPVVYSA